MTPDEGDVRVPVVGESLQALDVQVAQSATVPPELNHELDVDAELLADDLVAVEVAARGPAPARVSNQGTRFDHYLWQEGHSYLKDYSQCWQLLLLEGN